MSIKELHTLPPVKPGFIQPMYVTSVCALPEEESWAYEAKLDGYRCIAGKNGGVTLWSRRGTLFTPRFPEIALACEKLPPDTVIDGEVVAIGDDGRISFNLLQHHRPKAHHGATSVSEIQVFALSQDAGRPLEKSTAVCLSHFFLATWQI